METHTIQEYMHIGAMNWFLVRLPDVVRAKGSNSAYAAIKDFKDNIQKADLTVTYRAGVRLWAILDKLGVVAVSDNVPQELIQEIRTEANDIEKTLVAESLGKLVFVVTEKRIDSDKLVHNPATLLAGDVWISMPRISAYDFRHACHAIAFELPTAGAFHLLRCVEGIIKHYYMCIVKRDRLPEDKRMWGPMVQQMREKKREHPPIELLDTLDRIRINFRNPTNHPEKMYDMDEVQDLFGLCVDALNRIVKSKYWEVPSDSYSMLSRDLGEKQKDAT